MVEKAKFGSKIGLVAATVGSAIGLGNVWRFPAETQANGGAAFLIVYVLCVLILGIPVMLAEFSLGRSGGTDAVGAYRKFSRRTPWWLAGALPVLAAYLILSFYMVVAGWTLEYFLQSLTGHFTPEWLTAVRHPPGCSMNVCVNIYAARRVRFSTRMLL